MASLFIAGGFRLSAGGTSVPAYGFHFLIAATLAFIRRHQPPLFHVELLFLHDLPFVKAMLAKTLGLGGRFFEGQYIAHAYLS